MNRIEETDFIKSSYLETHSVAETAKDTGMSIVKVRRVLIKAGLWESETSKAVKKLYEEGHSTDEIAFTLGKTNKAVQAYLPYTRGTYNQEKTKDSTKSKSYRNSKANALVNITKKKCDASLFYNQLPAIDSLKKYPDLPKIEELRQVKLGETLMEFKKGEKVPDKEFKLKLLEEGKRPKYASVSGNLTLHQLSYLCRDLFNIEAGEFHHFEIPKESYEAFSSDKYIGSIFNPFGDKADECWDDDYDGKVSLKSWYKGKYKIEKENCSAFDNYFMASESTGNHQNRLSKRLKLKNVLTSKCIDNEVYSKDFDKRILSAKGRLHEFDSDGISRIISDSLRDLAEYRKAKLAVLSDKYNKSNNPEPKEYYIRYYKAKEAEICKQVMSHISYLQPELLPFTNMLIFRAGARCILLTEI